MAISPKETREEVIARAMDQLQSLDKFLAYHTLDCEIESVSLTAATYSTMRRPRRVTTRATLIVEGAPVTVTLEHGYV